MTVERASMRRRLYAAATAATGAVAASLVLAACAGTGPHGAPVLAAPAGSSGLLSTSQGVIWSFPHGQGGNAVLRGRDHGRNWLVALPGQGPTSGLVASFFLGPGTAWVVEQHLTAGRGAERVVLGTSNGGRHWWRSKPLPGHVTAPGLVPHDQIYFTDGVYGWLLAAGTRGSTTGGQLSTRQSLLLSRTSDGGRTWTQVPPRGLPMQGRSPTWIGTHAGGCADQPTIAFANPDDGWLTDGACGPAGAGPQIWRTSDGGRTWVPATLAAPAGGWRRWISYRYPGAQSIDSDAGRISVGQPHLVADGVDATVLVPIAVGASGLLIEQSQTGGRTWRIAGRVRTGAVPTRASLTSWFDPIDARQWVISAPGRLIETSDAGRHWTFYRSAVSMPGAPVSFTNLRHGFIQGSGAVAAQATWDNGERWIAQQAPPWSGAGQSSAGQAISTVQLVSPRLAVAAGSAGLETSADGGQTWTQRLSVPDAVSQVDFVSPAVGFAVTAGELLRSTDGGLTWQAIDQPLAGPVARVSFWSADDGAADVLAQGSYQYFITRDSGTHWTPLRLPAGWTAQPGGVAGGAPGGPATSPGYPPAAACFTGGGTGWVVAEHDQRDAVLVTSDGGRHWRIGLWPRSLQVATANGTDVGLAGCAGHADWVELAQGAAHSATLAFDLLSTTDLGHSWQDVLRTPDQVLLAHPAVPLGPDGNFDPAGLGSSALIEPIAAATATSAFCTFTSFDHGLAIASTANAGTTWTWHIFAPPHPGGQPAKPGIFPPPEPWLTTTALNATSAWTLYAGTPGSGTSDLYGTSDGGSTWRLITVFKPPA